MTIQVLTETHLRRMIPAGTPLFGIKFSELLVLPIFVIRYAVKARSVTFGPKLSQIQWCGTLDGSPIVMVYHVRGNRAMIAHDSRLRTVNGPDLLAALRKTVFN